MPTVSTPSRQPAVVSSQPLATSPGGSDEFTRLHITPLDAELLKVIVPASALPAAQDISYHTIETFPEKRYGFVNLPKADADKLRAKLNGAVLKGCKIRIEKARPEKTFEPAGMEEKKSKKDKDSSKHKSESSKKRKREDNVVGGVALTDRKVKRGWTETPGESAKRKKKDRSEKGDKGKEKKKKRTKSKYTDQEECLLKTKIPPNAMGNISKDDVSHKKKKRGKGSSREVTVHEFEKTTKFPSFLKDSSSGSSRPAAAEYVEGKGWVDEDGNTVEPVTIKKPAKPVKSASKKTPVQEEEDSDDTSSSGSSSSSEAEAESEADAKTGKRAVSEDDSDTSSSGSSDDDDDEDVPKTVEHVTPKLVTMVVEAAQPASSPTARNLTIKIPPPTTPSDGKVHPLEALYKRPKPADGTNETPAAQKSEPFTFFGGVEEEGEDDDDGGEVADKATPMPMTPFTRQEFEWRTVRSAAPTPDTAHPSRMQNILWSSQQDGDVDDDMEDAESEGEDEEGKEEEDADGETGANSKAPTSDFQAWFWENRRDLNQSWMKRRKTAAKEKRHRENKARASRAV
ncbi:hypothetical protein ACRE_037410 [Hapsidospora chrysogenum ATCC 11550]|uniref:Uncharacterized protein n=1 Tax=Hapsidospora chrysogenum (strain ATCC 11550 / CBS 779.69 / DSM 880 / IAM 14645 / JCM 23072 / IMI 49137) TaxID=857340 RepID=A0A086T7S2_HAPC1|nr:hypothetical protein ACRE_037410 [Hapsidospora chrysogenum ATCC 11550]